MEDIVSVKIIAPLVKVVEVHHHEMLDISLYAVVISAHKGSVINDCVVYKTSLGLAGSLLGLDHFALTTRPHIRSDLGLVVVGRHRKGNARLLLNL